MNTIDEIVYQALISDTVLLSLLARGRKSIYQNVAPDTGAYPYIVCTQIVSSGSLYGDDAYHAESVTERFTIVTRDGNYNRIANQLKTVTLQDTDFIWSQDTRFNEDVEQDLIVDFSLAREV